MVGGLAFTKRFAFWKNFRKRVSAAKCFFGKYPTLITILITTSLACVPFPSMAQIENPGDFNTVSLYLENDAFAGTDQNYTSGFRLAWISRDLRDYRENFIGKLSYPVIKLLPFFNAPGFQRAIYLALGQNIYTPVDTKQSDLIEDDRPYAGYSYFAVGIQSKDSYRMHTLEFSLGIIGPSAFAEETQERFHDLLGQNPPQGWDNQLEDEPTLEVNYLRKTKIWQAGIGRHLGADLIPHVGAALGNVHIYANGGGQIRFGWNLPNDFGTFLIRPGCECNVAIDRLDPRFFRTTQFGIHLFVAVDGRIVLRDIFLDGNTFKESHSVEKNYLTADILFGVGFLIKRFKISYAYVYETKKFKLQEDEHVFGTFTLSYSF